MTSTPCEEAHIHDVIGIGFGPANIAFAVAVADEQETQLRRPPLDVIFFDASPAADWHPGMLLPDTVMQIAFPKDLATLRNPRSRFSFFNYLFEHNRLADFINLQTFFPSREELRDYIRWTAQTVGAQVHYHTQVQAITHEGAVAVVHTIDANGTEQTHRARAVVIATGLSPKLPENIHSSSRISHNIHMLPFLEAFTTQHKTMQQQKVAILGGGQSAAEITRFLHSTFPDAEIHLIHRRYGLTPSDDSPFANRVFDPDAVDKWHAAATAEREYLRAIHAGTNYTAVDPDLLAELFRMRYDEQLSGSNRLFLHDTTSLTALNEDAEGVNLELVDHMSTNESRLKVDMLICATGFTESDPRDLLTDFPDIPSDANNRVLVEHDYRLNTGDSTGPAIYLSGGVEHSHGFSSSLLSLVSIRAGEILQSIRRNLDTTAAEDNA